jgi:Uma2 family endonuclease
MENVIQTIPKSLIYETVDGNPIYYRGYKDYLSGKKQLEELMGSSFLQSSIITELVYVLVSTLGKKYKILSNELGLHLSKGSQRAADIALLDKYKIKDIKEKKKYLDIPPDVVIEVDIKAEDEEKDSFNYVNKKTEELLAFGVKKVIWIFTDSEKVLLAENDKNWELTNWSKEIEIIDDIKVNIRELAAQ